MATFALASPAPRLEQDMWKKSKQDRLVSSYITDRAIPATIPVTAVCGVRLNLVVYHENDVSQLRFKTFRILERCVRK